MKLPMPGDMGKSRKRKRKSKRELQPGILLSWESWDEESMREFLEEVVREFGDEMDEMEAVLRNQN